MMVQCHVLVRGKEKEILVAGRWSGQRREREKDMSATGGGDGV
jgi:hypothetical protein